MLNNNESAMRAGWANKLEAEHNSGAPEPTQFCDHCDEMTEHSDGLDTECGQCGGDYGGTVHDLIQKLERKIEILERKNKDLALALRNAPLNPPKEKETPAEVIWRLSGLSGLTPAGEIHRKALLKREEARRRLEEDME